MGNQCCTSDDSAVKVEEVKNVMEETAPAPAAEPTIVEEAKPVAAEVEAPPAPKPEQEASPTTTAQDEQIVLTVTDANGTTKEVKMSKGPMGMSYKNTFPITIVSLKPNGAAQQAGVALGAKVVKVDGVDLVDFASGDKAIKNASRKSVMTFDDAGTTTDIVIRQGPLGMSYQPNVHPVVVDTLQPGGNAEKAGVKKGMKLVKLDGVDMLSCDFAAADEAIKNTSKRLSA